MSCGRVLLDKLRHFFKYKKIITARMHARGNDDVDNKTSDKMTRKMRNGTKRATTHTWAPWLLSQDLSFRFQAMVTGEVVDDVGLWVDGGTRHRLSTSLSLHHVLDPSDPLHQ
jgi:hypothetical protein